MSTEDYHNSHLVKSLLSAFVCISLAAGIYFGIKRGHISQGAETSFVHVNKKAKSNICVIVESGHGGISNNVYLTLGKQSPEWPDGLKIYEGYSCKMLATDFVRSLLDADIDAFLLNSEVYDYSNIVRAERVNSWLKLDSRIIFVSLHHNAQPTDKADYTDKYGVKGYMNNGATGVEIYTSKGKTKSDSMADYIYTELSQEFTDLKFRCDWSDGDADKEANFTVLTATHCPAVLIEWLFMTTYSDCKIIADKNYRKRYIKALTRAMVAYNQSIKQH
jgi:N-acetylmuramoyl-L-alanine amidase